MVSFQNCGKAGFDDTSEETLNLSSSSSKTDSDPFAYNAAFDQIAYNSCFGPAAFGKEGFFSIKAGAYSSGGVSLRQEFEDYVKNGKTLKPLHPATEVSVEQVKAYLSESGANKTAIPQMALRDRLDFQHVLRPNTRTTVTEHVDFVPMLGDLSDDRWLDPIVRNGSVGANLFFPYAPEGARRLEATLAYNSTEAMAEAMRNDVSRDGLLALTFKVRPDLGDAMAARSPSSDVARAYGRGYRLSFGSAVSRFTACAAGNCGNYAVPIPGLSPTNILTGVQETDLENPEVTLSSWSCSEARRYTIVRYADRHLCPADSVSSLTTEAIRKEYQILRRQLPEHLWTVNMTYRCVVPLKSGCYDPNFTGAIAYDQRQPCYLDAYISQYGSNRPSRLCAQFVSICVKP